MYFLLYLKMLLVLNNIHPQFRLKEKYFVIHEEIDKSYYIEDIKEIVQQKYKIPVKDLLLLALEQNMQYI